MNTKICSGKLVNYKGDSVNYCNIKSKTTRPNENCYWYFHSFQQNWKFTISHLHDQLKTVTDITILSWNMKLTIHADETSLSSQHIQLEVPSHCRTPANWRMLLLYRSATKYNYFYSIQSIWVGMLWHYKSSHESKTNVVSGESEIACTIEQFCTWK